MKAARRRAQAEIAAWKANILSRAAAAEARGTFDVHELGARVLGALRASRERPRPALDLLREHARQGADVSRLVLATLFLVSAAPPPIAHSAAGPPTAPDRPLLVRRPTRATWRSSRARRWRWARSRCACCPATRGASGWRRWTTRACCGDGAGAPRGRPRRPRSPRRSPLRRSLSDFYIDLTFDSVQFANELYVQFI